MEDYFYYENLSFFSVELHWKNKYKYKNSSDLYEYELYQKEGGNNFFTNFFLFKKIYEGGNTNYKVTKLNPGETYTFKLNIIKNKESFEEKKITIKTLYHSSALISENSIEIAKGENIKYEHKLEGLKEKITRGCSKLIFEGNDEIIVKGDFEGIEIKITHEDENNIYYISFDIKSYYLEEFFNTYIEESKNDIIIPCHFILEKLPYILILNLIEKGAVIFTGRRLGGVIASSLAFYILFLGNFISNNNNIYSNTFENAKQKSIGVVTFGSPSFLYNLNIGYKMKEFVSYFINIKEEFDYIPSLIDFINFGRFIKMDSIFSFLNEKIECPQKPLLIIFQKTELDNKEKNYLYEFSKDIGFTKENLETDIKGFKSIPFGFYYMVKDSKFYPKYEYDFNDFYYFIPILKNNLSNLNSYKKIKSENVKFDKKNLNYLEKNDYQLELIKILRRKIKDKSMKGIIKFKLIENDNIIISPDIINKIELKLIHKTVEINNKNIFYDNDIDITAYIDNLNENINDIIIYNNFGGKIKVKHIINVQGSGRTKKMLKVNIEKLFLIPFFKLFEIFYASINDKEKYEKLKIENFGENFQDLKILEPFKKQIKFVDELLFFSRPDILGKFENEFKTYFEKKLTIKQLNCFNNLLKNYYNQAIILQKMQNINCAESQINSIAKKNSFPLKIEGDLKKLFMCKPTSFELDNIISQKFHDDIYVKNFFIEQMVMDKLKIIEKNIKYNMIGKSSNDCKNYLLDQIGNLYNENIVPNCYFIETIILSSIESGDYIKFNHKFDEEIGQFIRNYFIPHPNDIVGTILITFYGIKAFLYTEKDFKKNYTKKKIEEIHIKNLFFKKKVKNIIRSNISNNNFMIKNMQKLTEFLFKENKISNFSHYSENQVIGEEYYYNFLELLNNYSNDFPEDIEISIYENLREETNNKKQNLLTINEMINDLIDDKESKKGFLALVRQSFLLGKLRCNIVSNI